MNLSTVKWAQWDKTQSRELLVLFICVCSSLCTVVAHNIAQNRPDNFPSYPPDNHHCFDDVYLKEGGRRGEEGQWKHNSAVSATPPSVDLQYYSNCSHGNTLGGIVITSLTSLHTAGLCLHCAPKLALQHLVALIAARDNVYCTSRISIKHTHRQIYCVSRDTMLAWY